MMNLNDVLNWLPILAAWVATPIGTNAAFAAICAAGICGLSPRACLVLTTLMHIALIVL